MPWVKRIRSLGLWLVVMITCAVVLFAAFIIAKAIGIVSSNPEIERWLTMPVSELKVWHLILIIFFVSWLANE